MLVQPNNTSKDEFWCPLTTASGKPTRIRANDPESLSTRLGKAIFWPIAMLRLSLGSCSQDTMSGLDTSAGEVVGPEAEGQEENKWNTLITVAQANTEATSELRENEIHTHKQQRPNVRKKLSFSYAPHTNRANDSSIHPQHFYYNCRPQDLVLQLSRTHHVCIGVIENT